MKKQSFMEYTLKNKLMTKRIFIAASVSKTLKEKVLSFQNHCKSQYLRCLTAEDLHITLVPPWKEDNMDNIKKIFSQLELNIASFNVQFDKICYGPVYNQKCLWAEGKYTRNLNELRIAIYQGFREKEIELPLERRRFLLHLTMGRINPDNVKKTPKINETILWNEYINNICIFESTLLPEGATYSIVSKINLLNSSEEKKIIL